MKEIAYNREFFEKVINIARQHGEVIDADQESLREAVDSGALYVKADRGHIALGILRLMAAIFEQIARLHVTLWYPDGPDWFFVPTIQLVCFTRYKVNQWKTRSWHCKSRKWNCASIRCSCH